RVTMSRTEHLKEGQTFYRMLDLTLSRERIPSLSRSWTVMHPVVAGSPLADTTPKRLQEDDAEFTVSVVGIDDTTMQAVHASHQYFARQVMWGARHGDVLTGTPAGLKLDLRRFHDIEPTPAADGFPYSMNKLHVSDAPAAVKVGHKKG